ncbi:hypothetical protein DICPUDRAFT_16626, partial [Dictyostelium purpureum]
SEEFERISNMSYQEFKEEQAMNSFGSVKEKPYYTGDYSRLSFIDKIRVNVKAGDGGDGGISFYRAKYIPEGPPDGGNGGNGANVIIRADLDNNNLSHLKKNYVGKHGGKGLGERRAGGTGEDIVLRVPVGTVIRELYKPEDAAEHDDETIISKKDPRYDPESPEFEPNLYLKALSSPLVDGKINDETNVIDHLGGKGSSESSLKLRDTSKIWQVSKEIDMDEPGKELVICKGGHGGKGNANFSSGSNRSPDYSEPGTKGEIKYIELELKIIADFGLVGFPNAGKSTLLSVISNAIPNIKSYAFTTMNPYVGTIDFIGSNNINNNSNNNNNNNISLSRRRRKQKLEPTIDVASIADLPGILEGAHLNLGLGLGFLRHIERTKAIVYVIDMSNSNVPAFWDGKKLKVKPNRYSHLTDKEDITKQRRQIKTKVKDETYRAPWKDFKALLEELESYKPGLTKKPSVIVANKMDGTFAKEHLADFEKAIKSLGDFKIVPIIAKDGENINGVKDQLKEILKDL